MTSESTNGAGRGKGKLLYPELSYQVTGILFEVHNKLGRFAREKTYCDQIALGLKSKGIDFTREFRREDSGDRVDFLVDNKLILEAKTKSVISKEDYFQIQRYLQEFKIELGLLVNFRNRYLRPLRILRVKPY